MKQIEQVIDIRDQDNALLFEGKVVMNIKPRAERASLASELEQVQNSNEKGPKFIEFSERMIKDHLVAIDVVHVPSGEEIKSIEDLEYINCERLLAMIAAVATNGRILGKKTA